jgi:hypothetical protein
MVPNERGIAPPGELTHPRQDTCLLEGRDRNPQFPQSPSLWWDSCPIISVTIERCPRQMRLTELSYPLRVFKEVFFVFSSFAATVGGPNSCVCQIPNLPQSCTICLLWPINFGSLPGMPRIATQSRHSTCSCVSCTVCISAIARGFWSIGCARCRLPEITL